MENKTFKLTHVLPVLFGFFVMGFCDVVGISTSYIKHDFNLSETVAGFVPSMVFFWFLLLSVPTAILMNRVGRKVMVQVSNVITIIGMALPFFFHDNFTAFMVAFALLGIGNTILQVALNPLLTNVVSGDVLTSSLTAGQVVKAVSSFCGPLLAAFALNSLDNWHYIFPIYAGITLISSIWLMSTPIAKESVVSKASGIGATFSLLKDIKILLLFLGIVFVVGTDVGMNTVTPKLLIERCMMSIDDAGLGSSVYFACRTAGAFVGVFLLARLSASKYFVVSVVTALVALVALLFVQDKIAILTLVGVIGFACSSVFSIIYSLAIQARPEKANEISGLMVTGVFGGAVIPPVMGFLTDKIGNQTGSIFVIIGCICYLIFCSVAIKTKKTA